MKMNNILPLNTSTKSVIKLSFFNTGKVISNSNNTIKNNFDRFNLDELKRNQRILQSFKRLGANWNDNAARSFPEELIQKVSRILRKMEYQPQIFPTGRNSIQLEFVSRNDDYLEFEIYTDRIVAFKEINKIEWENEVSENMVFELSREFNDR